MNTNLQRAKTPREQTMTNKPSTAVVIPELSFIASSISWGSFVADIVETVDAAGQRVQAQAQAVSSPL